MLKWENCFKWKYIYADDCNKHKHSRFKWCVFVCMEMKIQMLVTARCDDELRTDESILLFYMNK